MAKKDAKTKFIWWVLLLQEIDFEVKDQNGCENWLVDHIFRRESNKEVAEENDLAYVFPDDFHGALPRYANFANFVVWRIIPDGLKPYQVRYWFTSDAKKYYCNEAHLFLEFADNIIRRCVSQEKT